MIALIYLFLDVCVLVFKKENICSFQHSPILCKLHEKLKIEVTGDDFINYVGFYLIKNSCYTKNQFLSVLKSIFH